MGLRVCEWGLCITSMCDGMHVQSYMEKEEHMTISEELAREERIGEPRR